MKCPFCGEIDNKVIDSRLSKDGTSSEDAGNASCVEGDLPPMNILKRFLL